MKGGNSSQLEPANADAAKHFNEGDSDQSVYEDSNPAAVRQQLSDMLADDTEGYLLDKAENEIKDLRCAAFSLDADEFMEL